MERRLNELEERQVKDFVEDFGIKQEILEDKIREIYRSFVLDYMGQLLEKFDIAKTVEEKIKQMDVLELEKMILQVMKKELGAIVNLGALIGFGLGCLNMVL